MGMLMAMTLLKQKEEEAAKAAKVNAEEIPFTEPEEPAEEQPKEAQKPAIRGRRKSAK